MDDKHYVWLFAILFLAVGLSLGFGIMGVTGNAVAKPSASLPVVPNAGGEAVPTTPATYFDPMSCEHRVFNESNIIGGDNLFMDCSYVNGKKAFYLETGYAFCSTGYTPEVTGYSYWTVGNTPAGFGYVCVNDVGNRIPATFGSAFCCEIKGGDASGVNRGAIQTATIDQNGKVTYS